MKDFKQFLFESEKTVSMNYAMEIGNKYGVDWNKYDREQFRKGLGVEFEHSETVGDDLRIIKNIVLDHLDEDPKYYEKLVN